MVLVLVVCTQAGLAVVVALVAALAQVVVVLVERVLVAQALVVVVALTAAQQLPLPIYWDCQWTPTAASVTTDTIPTSIPIPINFRPGPRLVTDGLILRNGDLPEAVLAMLPRGLVEERTATLGIPR